MTAVALALLAGTLAAEPLPDNKTPIDSLTYTFGGGGLFSGGGSLTISADGKVKYFYSSAPHTNSGGRVVQQSWELTKEERTALFRKLVDDGLLEAEEGANFLDGIRVTHGRWRTTIAGDKVPDKAMAHLRPLLSKADPVMWGEKKPAPAKEPAAKPGTLRQFNYYFAPKAEGDHILLYVGRGGEVSYQRYGPVAGAPGTTKTHVQTSWKIPRADAEAVLDALVADGALDLETAEQDRFPVHRVEAQVGRWTTTFYTKPLPEKLTKQLLPLLKKADAEFWK
jgi:hypothetical protein